MKTILVPTDYSEVAENAMQYAIELAKFCDARLILMHAYQVPVPTTEMPIMLVNPRDLADENLKRLKKLEEEVAQQTKGEVRIESVLRLGFTVEEILNASTENNVDLTVMGITGTSKLAEVLIGSHTTAVINRAQTPVLAIPAGTRYRRIEKILLAYDHHELVNVASLEQFKKIAQLFDANVLALNVEKPVAVPVTAYENTPGDVALENSLKDIEHIVFFGISEDLTEEINSFADVHDCDWIAMIPHKHNILNRLFHESNTKKMAFHTHIPLLSIHD